MDDYDWVRSLGWSIHSVILILSNRSASAGAVASFCTNPLDLIKLRLQIQRGKIRTLSSQQHYTGVLDGLQKTIRTEGSRALFKGAGARMAFHAPSTAITIALYERCKSMAKEVL